MPFLNKRRTVIFHNIDSAITQYNQCKNSNKADAAEKAKATGKSHVEIRDVSEVGQQNTQ